MSRMRSSAARQIPGESLLGFVHGCRERGLQCPALPLHWHLKLGFGTFAVDLVFGSQFAAAMVLRLWAFGPPEY